MEAFYNAFFRLREGRRAAYRLSSTGLLDAATPSLRAPSIRRAWIALGIAWLLCLLYVWPFVERGWVPHDEGTIAQSAALVLDGALPHRDYGEPYTGGLTYAHAGAFRLLGVRLSSLRMMLLVAFLGFVPAVFAIARRLASAWVAGLLTLTAAAWSVPNYFASLPSWYNLFFATFGALALVRHVEDGRRRWLFAAGLCAGLSILCKVVGLYDVAAVLLFLAYREQRVAAVRGGPGTGCVSVFFALKLAGGVVFLAAVGGLLRARHDPMDWAQLFAPAAALVSVLVWSEWKEGRGAASVRAREAWRLAVPFGAGLALPLAVLLVPFVRAGAVADLVRGVVDQPLRHIQTSRTPFPSLASLLPAVPYALVVAFPEAFRRTRPWMAAALGAVLALALLLASREPVYTVIWDSARSLGVLGVLAGCGRLAWSAGREGPSDGRRQVAFLLLCAAALVGFVQYPFSAPIYFCFVAPLVVLAVAAVVAGDPPAVRRLHACVLAFYLLFALAWTNPGYVYALGRHPTRYRAETGLAVARAGLRVPAADARVYETLLAELERRAPGGEIYAGPDSPEVYFLSGRRGPGRYFFDFLGGLDQAPALLALLDERPISAVVLNRSPGFSRPPDGALRAEIARRYPHSLEIGKFTLFWRDGQGARPRL